MKAPFVTPDTKLEGISSLSKKIILPLHRLEIFTMRDLLFYFPFRYDNFGEKIFIRDLVKDSIATIEGEITSVSIHRTAKKRMSLTEIKIKDETGSIKAIWFNQPFISRNIHKGTFFRFSGKVALGPRGLYFPNPSYEKILGKTEIKDKGIHTGGLTAIYPETQGITSRWLRYLMKQFLPLRIQLKEFLPQEILRENNLPFLHQAIYQIHFPQSIEEAKNAARRFKFEKIFLLRLRALQEKFALHKQTAPKIIRDINLLKRFVSSLPFQLTDAQRKAIWEIASDLEQGQPMNRLLEGDVGSGKTIVAAAVSLLAANSGFSTAFMAPTEVLAEQHYSTFKKILSPFKITPNLMTSSKKIIGDKSSIFIGTHALIQKNINLENLGLVIIDEQHRFGVAQRGSLTKKNSTNKKIIPHFLSMTATPIPRTLAITIFGDLDISLLNEMPKARKKIITKIVSEKERPSVYEFISSEIRKGRQIFVVCPRIEILNKEKNAFSTHLAISDTKAVTTEYKKLKDKIFPDFKVGMLHGKMKSEEKNRIMKEFKANKINILVSTSVIEVGVDVPNATIIIIEGAERFGLAQLHQFRGRVGRGEYQSYCFLLPTDDSIISSRLRAITKTENGFDLAEIDLQIRGMGDIFGTRQWGISSEILSSLADVRLVREVQKSSENIFKKDPSLTNFPLLKQAVEKIEAEIHLE